MYVGFSRVINSLLTYLLRKCDEINSQILLKNTTCDLLALNKNPGQNPGQSCDPTRTQIADPVTRDPETRFHL